MSTLSSLCLCTSIWIAIALISTFLLTLTPTSAQNIVVPGYETHWYTQNMTHFDPTNGESFQQRYILNSSYFDPDAGVIFFYAGNEGPVDWFWNNTGLMFQWATQFKAMVVSMEHRYYGESLPFGDDFSAPKLKYLTMENAIADFAAFVTWFKTANAIPDAMPVIVFGGSYGGVLSALCRVHYPSVFDMALSASAPIPQLLNVINGTIFFKIVTNDYYNVDPQCVDAVRDGFTELLQAGKMQEYQKLVSTFQLCPGTPMNSPENVTYLALWARNAFLTMAMGDYPYAADFLGDLPAWPVNYTCEQYLLSNKYDSAMDALAAAAGFYYNASAFNSLPCHNMTAEYVYCADQTGCGTGTDAIAWDYQMCTQVVYAMDTNNVTDMFPPRVWEWPQLIEYCTQTYGVTPEMEWMRIWYPLEMGKAGSRIIFSNGLLDPWSGGGYLTNLSDSMPAIVIPPGAHHLDLRGRHTGDPASVVQARELENAYLVNWLKEMGHSVKS